MFQHEDPQAFPLFDERIIPGCAKLVSWCPTRDLVVLVKPDNNVLFYRGGIVQIWSMPCPVNADIVVLAWKPNGKEFVFGCNDGSVIKVDATHDAPKHIQCWPSGPSGIASLAWVAYSRESSPPNIYGFDPKAFDLETSLPSLSTVPLEEPAPILPNLKTKKQPLPEETTSKPEGQTLLLIGDNHGKIHLSLNGMFHIGTLAVTADTLGEQAIVSNLAINPNMLSIQALLQGSHGRFFLASIDTRILQSKKTELCNIAVEQTRIDYLLRYITQCASMLETHHSTIVKLATQEADKVSRVLMDHDDKKDAMPEVELLGLVARGCPTQELHDYFTKYLNEQQVKRWETRAGHSYACAQTIACEYLQPACERLLLHLSMLYGYSRWKERYEGLLDEEAVKSCIDTISLYLDRLRGFVASVSKMRKLFQEFIAWIFRVVQKLAEQDSPDAEKQDVPLCVNPKLVIEYLNTSFVSDSLADYFVGVQVSHHRRDPSTTLKQTLHRLTHDCEVLLKQPSAILSEQLQVTALDSLKVTAEACEPRQRGRSIASCTTTCEDDTAGHQVFVFAHQRGLTVVRNALACSAGVTDKVGFAELVIEDDTMQIADMEFFDSTELGLVVQQGSQSYLGTIALEQLTFRPTGARETQILSLTRVMALSSMIQVVMGTNGHPRRRIICVVASSGKTLVLEMDPVEPDEDETMD